MLDNDYINYFLVGVLIIIIGTFLYKLIVLINEGVTVLSQSMKRLKPISEGVENINHIVTDNMEPISNGVASISTILDNIKVLVTNVSEAFTKSKEKRAAENKIE